MENPTGYVYRVALNLHRRHLRRARMIIRKLPARARDPDLVAEAEMRTDVMRALLAIPPTLRTALVLTEWMGATSEEAAEVMGVKPGSARARVHRARAAFREQLGEGYA